MVPETGKQEDPMIEIKAPLTRMSALRLAAELQDVPWPRLVDTLLAVADAERERCALLMEQMELTYAAAEIRSPNSCVRNISVLDQLNASLGIK